MKEVRNPLIVKEVKKEKMAVYVDTFLEIVKVLSENCFSGKVGGINSARGIGVVPEPSASLTAEAITYLEHLAEIGVPEAGELLAQIPGLVVGLVGLVV